MHPRRLARINEQILQVVSQTALDLKDPGIGFVTFTGAKVSSDVSLARIFYSVLGSEEEKEKTAVALDRARPYIRGELARLENFRRVPNILFVYDDAAEKADRVNRILHKIHKEDPDVSDAPAD